MVRYASCLAHCHTFHLMTPSRPPVWQMVKEAAEHLATKANAFTNADLRDYEWAARILQYFEIPAVRLMSNNPKKIEAVEREGIQVVERVPIIAQARDSREAYLRTKKDKMGHLF